MTRVPLRRRDGSVRAYALIDDADAGLVSTRRWSLMSAGYVAAGARAGMRPVLLHRFLFGLERGNRLQVDHINHDKLDNRRSNLRLATNALNNQNKLPKKGCSSPYRGVSWHQQSRKWLATIAVNGKYMHIGSFVHELDAARAASEARAIHMPFSADAAMVTLQADLESAA